VICVRHGTEHPEIKRHKIGALDEVEIMRYKRVQQTAFDDQRRRMDHGFKDLANHRNELTKLKVSMRECTIMEDRERSNEMEKERAEKNALASAGLSFGGGHKGYLADKKPTADEMVNFFNEKSSDLELTEDDLMIRDLARRNQIPIPDVEKVKTVFDKYDTSGDHQIDKDEFKHMMNDLICVGKLKGMDVPNDLLERHWLCVDSDKSGEVDFEEFCEWWFFAFMPMHNEQMEKAKRILEAKKQIKKNSQNEFEKF